ncbi:MAG: polysaccharide deacetylase family protein [Chitinophagaceae bacterium]|nr:polysaccharide deacetylase family protein [Chitinophagaceae bacterium]
MKNTVALILTCTCMLTQLMAQNGPWRGKKTAVVITYDDAINEHLDNAIPVLDSLGLKATFYITAYSQATRTRINDWRKIAAQGHELGNHTLFHPCNGGAGREWVKPDYDLRRYTIQRMVDETRMTNTFLEAVDGKTKRTFAYTCADTRIGDSAFLPLLKNDFVAVRNVRNAMHTIDQVDLYDLDCFMVNGETGEQMIEWVRKASASQSLLVLLFHGVGGGNGLNVSLPAHRQLLEYLKQNEKDIWVAPMIEVAEHIKDWQNRDHIRKQTEIDHKDMLSKLNVTSLRPGANGNNPNAPNAANYDEAKANPFPTLPDPLRLKNGKKVTTAKTWWNKRRPEIIEDFDREIYGRTPANTPRVNWEVVSVRDTMNGSYPVRVKKLIGHVDNSSYPSVKVDIDLTLAIPSNAVKPVPVIMEFGFVFPPGFRLPQAASSTGPTWQQQCLARGWGYAILLPTSVQADNGAGLTQGIIGLMNKGQRRKPDDWGSLKAWAWGASRALDYFETDKAVDADKVAIEGHSRFGKAALVTLAYDQRFATGFISSSGEGGAKLHRRNAGEIVENVASSGEYHWMAGNFIKYAGPLTWGDLPVDSHELIALCAPRPVFISSGDKGDGWVDARGMFMAAVGAGPVYKLVGKKDLGTDVFPSVETGLMSGEVAFKQHSGGHTPAPNWEEFLEFAARYFE